MNKYRVKLTFKYSDIVHVEAETEERAIEIALEECEEQYESFYDANVALESHFVNDMTVTPRKS